MAESDAKEPPTCQVLNRSTRLSITSKCPILRQQRRNSGLLWQNTPSLYNRLQRIRLVPDGHTVLG